VSIRTQILLALLVIGLPLVAINAWWITRQQGWERQRVLERLHNDAQDASAIVQVFLTDLADRGQQTALHVPHPDRLQAYLKDRLAYFRYWNAHIMGLAWTDPNGEILAAEPADIFQPGARFAGLEALQPLRGGRDWALDELVIEESGGRAPGILRMVARETGRPLRGMVGILFNPEGFQPLILTGRLWSRIRLADQTGRLVYATDWANPSLDDRFGWAAAPGLRDARSRGTSTLLVGRIPGDGEGREWMVAHVPIPEIGWVASALIPEAEAMGASRRALYGEAAIQAMLIILCAGAALILANRVARPARWLADAARRIAAGDRTARVGIQGQDELAMLGRSFDDMAGALDASWQALSAERDAAEGMAARLATLSQLASLASSSLDPSRVFEFIVEATSRLLDGAVVLLLVSDAEDGPLSLRATFGVTHPELRARNSFRAGEGLPGLIFQTREPLVLGSILEDPRALNRAWAEAEGLRAFAGVPLVLRDRCLGVLYAASRGEQPFAARDVDLLTSFAAHAATAIQNANLYERAAREAREKGLLLDELNHRVRNNLAMIVSFLELQRATPENREAVPSLEEAIGRVKGLALVHNVLGGASFQTGQYDALVHRLAEQTLLQGPLAGRVELRVSKQPLRLSSKALTALGIITNELFTNIAKHAFPDGRRGLVEITVEAAGADVVIRIWDNGVALPLGFAKGTGRLGLRLIQSLVEVSLQGTFSLEAGEGTTAIIRFPRSEDGQARSSPFPGEAQPESATTAALGVGT
jgi:two-component sensor histidine kinase/HAMP domain-containing protein